MNKETSKLTETSSTFLKFVRTKMVTKLMRSSEGEIHSEQISQSEIERFFTYPKYNRKAEIQKLVNLGELKITTVINPSGNKAFCYEAKPGSYDLSLLKPKMKKLDALNEKIRNNLLLVSLPSDAPSTTYFDLFLEHKNQFLDLFFNVDDFSGRIHTPISNFHSTHRPNILLNGQLVIAFDVAQSQPTILAKILTESIGDNMFSQWVDTGKDIYITLQEKAELKERKDAKGLFFKILFSKPDERLVNYFGDENWINWINRYKSSVDRRNPNNKNKPHSNMAWLLQATEVFIMRKIWKELADHNIPFLTVHDEIICSQNDAFTVKNIIDGILKKEYPVYKLKTSPKSMILN